MQTVQLYPDPKYVSENWGIDADGRGWGWFNGTIPVKCSHCGKQIVFGWVSGDQSICYEHVDDKLIFNQKATKPY